MPILHLTQQQLDDVTELMNRGLEDMEAHEKEGDLEVDGYTAEDLAERKRLKEAALPVKAIFRAAELRSEEVNKQALADVSTSSALLAYGVLEAFGAETGATRDEGLLDSTALLDLLVDFFHLAANNNIALDSVYDKARGHWEHESHNE